MQIFLDIIVSLNNILILKKILKFPYLMESSQRFCPAKPV